MLQVVLYPVKQPKRAGIPLLMPSPLRGTELCLGGRCHAALPPGTFQNADCFVHCYPNAGLPNPLSATGYDEKPEDTAQFPLSVLPTKDS
jgi:hypothetical protein